MKKFLFILLCLTLFITGCKPSVKGTVKEISSYGSVFTTFTIEEMLDKGFDYADIVKVEFENSGTYYMPITTAFTEVGIGKPSYCHYSKRGEASFGYCQGNFHRMCGGELGEKVKITMYEKQGYAEEYELLQSVYTCDRASYPDDYTFANFREIQTSNVKSKTLYRSGNPMNYIENPGRYIYVDSLASIVGIKSEIDIANSFKNDSLYVTSDTYTPKYCKNLLLTGHVCNLSMGSDTFCEEAYEGFAKGMRFIIDNPGPFLIHCNEGKDRCGFFCMLLESLAGASIEELEYDYMTTFCNLYYFERGTEKYNFNLSITGDRLIYLMKNSDDMENPNLDWNKALIELEFINPYDAAVEFLHIKCHMSYEEIAKLVLKITV